MKPFLNVGCGGRYRPGWTNVDFASCGDEVIGHDILTGLPFPDDTFDVVYHSHVLEHIPKALAPDFMKECWRVLRSGGVLRVVTPDLERLVREYLRTLEAAEAGDRSERLNYDWMMIHLYDQTVRERSGGEMGRWLSRQPVPNEDYALAWIGVEGKQIVDYYKQQAVSPPSSAKRQAPGIIGSLFGKGSWHRTAPRERLLQALLGHEYEALRVGRFRRSGEIHHWMYDRHSLARLLSDAGLSKPRKLSATESTLPSWSDHNLDTEPDGSVFHPDSIFMEATKP